MGKLDLIIFGCSKRAKEVEEICSHIPQINIIGYTDNNPQKWEDMYLGRPVFSLETFAEKCAEEKNIVVLAVVLEFDALVRQIEQMKLENKCFFSLYSILQEYNLFEQYKELILKTEELDNNSEILLIANNGLPKKEHLYRSGFTFRRLKAYRANGINIDAIGFTDGQLIESYYHEEELIVEGRENALIYLLQKNNYKKILVHFMSPEIMRIVDTYAIGAEIICWVHGYEILSWNRRLFNYSLKEIEEKKEQFEALYEKKKNFWKKMFGRDNTTFVFVSHWLKNIVGQDIGILPQTYYVIPNYIDSSLFSYQEKKKEDVYKVLAIKSNNTRMYANDIIVKVIQILAERDVFSKMDFNIYGDGMLFEENYGALIQQNYSNVHIHRSFLTQSEVADMHKSHGIFLCPTRQDTQGVSMCEAMCSGMVVVTNKVAAVPEYINNDCGILCDEESAEQMADAIEYLINNKNTYIEMSKKASEYMRERCSNQNTIMKEQKLII